MGGVSTAMAAAQVRAQTAAAGFGAVPQSSCACAAATVGSACAMAAASVGTGANVPRLCRGCTRAASARAMARIALRPTATLITELTGIFTAPSHHALTDLRQTLAPGAPGCRGGAVIREQPSPLRQDRSPELRTDSRPLVKQERRGAGAPPVAGFYIFAGAARGASGSCGCPPGRSRPSDRRASRYRPARRNHSRRSCAGYGA